MTFEIQNMSHDQIDAVAELWHVGWIDGHAAVVPATLAALRTFESFQKRSRDHLKDTRVAVQSDVFWVSQWFKQMKSIRCMWAHMRAARVLHKR